MRSTWHSYSKSTICWSGTFRTPRRARGSQVNGTLSGLRLLDGAAYVLFTKPAGKTNLTMVTGLDASVAVSTVPVTGTVYALDAKNAYFMSGTSLVAVTR